LTPLLAAGNVKEALAVSEMRLPGTDFPAHAGLLTVRGNSSLFFVLQPCDTTSSLCPAADDELSLWLQGGPGGPSQFGLFVENGPFTVNENLTLTANPYSWTRRFSMLWIDQPVGTGFSSAGDEAAYCTDDLCSAKDLYSALDQIATMFPQYKHLRIMGESYGGKWVPSAASYVLRQQQEAEKAGLEAPLGGMTLAGISVGDGWTDPINMLPEYVPLLNYVGILDEHGLASFGALMQQAIANTTSGDTSAAFRAWDAAINGDLTPGPPLLERLSGLDDYFNYDRTSQPASYNYWSQYVVQPAIRKELGVGDTPLHDGLAVEMALTADFMLSQASNLIYLLENNIPALVYVGQLDIIVGPALVDAYLKKLQWNGLPQYLAASRGIWKTADEPTEVAGWVRTSSPLTHVVVRNVGHIAPHDDPERMFDLVTSWADGKPLTP
jgi:vitellogenic carboxypeptidase-like protein